MKYEGKYGTVIHMVRRLDRVYIILGWEASQHEEGKRNLSVQNSSPASQRASQVISLLISASQ